MLTNETINVNNSIQVDNRSFCELETQCAICALTARIATAVVDFFSYIVVKIYESLVAFCEGFDRLITCANSEEEETPQPPPPPPNPPVNQTPTAGYYRFEGQDNFRQEFFRVDRNDNFDNLFQNLRQNRVPREVVVDYSYLDKGASSIPTETVKEKTPTAEEAQARRKEALERLKQISTTRFECPASILHFDLDETLEKYGAGKDPKNPSIFLIWYDYAMPDNTQRAHFQKITQRAHFQKILRGFNTQEGNDKFEAVRNLISKIYYILTEKKARVDKLPESKKKAEAEKALKQEIRYIITRFLNANDDCIDQTLTQLEDIAIEVLSTENPLGKNSAVSLLQYKASHVLFKHHANLLKEILVKDPALQDPLVAAHMADIEREVKKALAKEAGMKGKILEVGAQFEDMVKMQAEAAADRVGPILCQKYEPVEYLQEQAQPPWSDNRELRTNLLEWATAYYGLDGEDELSKAVVKSQEDLDTSCTIAGVELTIPGTQLFLEAAGIIQQRKG